MNGRIAVKKQSYQSNEGITQKATIRYIALSIIMFVYLFGIYTAFLPTWLLNYKSVSLVVFTIYIVFQKRISLNDFRYDKEFTTFFYWQIILFIYVFVIESIIGKGRGIRIFNSIITMLLYSPIILYGFKRLFRDNDELMKVLIYVSLVQSVIIISGMVFPAFRIFINQNFNLYRVDYATTTFEEGWESLYGLGYAVGISCATSKGSMILSLGIIACTYFLIQEKERIRRYLWPFILISIASTGLSRTGLVLSTIALTFIAFTLGKKSQRKLVKIIFIFVGVAAVAIVTISVTDTSSQLQNVFRRLLKTSESGLWESFFKSYFNDKTTVIPALDIRTFFGTGITSGISANGVTVNADGEFIRMYCSIGLIMTIINYLLIFGTLFKSSRSFYNKVDSTTVRLFCTILLYGVFKEYFIYDRYYILFVFLFISFARKKELKERDVDYVNYV